MFVPIGLLVQQETVLKTGEDIVKALDRWVLPSYPEFTTNNPQMTKTQCMGVLHSFYSAGRIHYSITPSELSTAVDAFLEDRLWVGPKTLQSIEIIYSQQPSFWLKQPNPLSCFFASLKVWSEAIRTTAVLILMAIGSVVYKLIPRKPFKLPENPTLKGKKS